MKRTKLIYLLGKNEKELLACDEYDSEGCGDWFTDNPILANEYYHVPAINEAIEKGLDVYMWEVTYDTNEKKIVKEEIWLQFTLDEAVKLKQEYAERHE